MSDLLHAWAGQWGAWAAERSLLLALVGLLLWVGERTLLRTAWPRLRLALHAAALVAPFVPAFAASRFSAATQLARVAPLGDGESALFGAVDPARAPASSVLLALFLVWAGVAAFLLVATLLHAARVRARLLAAAVDAPPALLRRVAGLARSLRLRRIPAVVVVPDAIGPLVIGSWRPRIVIPAALAARAADEATGHALLHELLHVKRGDLRAAALGRLATIAWWFHPMAWLVARRAAQLRELCCDDDVARRLREGAPAYRATLLDHARRLIDEPAPAGALGLFAAPSLLLARLDWLTRPRVHRPRLERATTLAAAAALLVAALPALPGSFAERAAARELDRARIAAFDLVRDGTGSQRPPGCMRLQYAVALLAPPQPTRSSP